jgi:putative endonuclease
MSRDRRVARGFGLSAESRAAWALRLTGWRILARGYLAHGGEIDIIARRGRVIAFVEVKARPSLEEALTAVTTTKRARLSRAARQWLAEHPRAMGLTLRGDLVAVAPRRWPRRLPAAIELDLGHA